MAHAPESNGGGGGAKLRVAHLGNAHLPPTPENYLPTNNNDNNNNHTTAKIRRAYTGDLGIFNVRSHHPQQQRQQQSILPKIFLLAELENATEVYALKDIPHIPLYQKIGCNQNNERIMWGCVALGVAYPREGNTLNFNAPDKPREIAIKFLDKRRLQRYLLRGGRENPYKEVARMQELGDNRHVLECLDCLETDDFLFIVSPAACFQGTLLDYIRRNNRHCLEEDQARTIFLQILDILDYFQQHNVCHHDFKPENLLFVEPDNLVAFDMATSLRIPTNRETGHRALITGQGKFGTDAYMSPEAYRGEEPFDGVALDLYAAGLILFKMLTGKNLFRQPDSDLDLCYRYFIVAENLWKFRADENESLDFDATYFFDPLQRASFAELQIAVQSLSIPVRTLLRNLLHENPLVRISLAETRESDWVQGINP
jgi:serine/threonine protein kinase